MTRLVLPESVKEIGGEAFQDCHQLTSVQFDKGLLYIKDHAFKNSGLASLELPEGIKEIGEWSFEGCKSLKTVQIPQSVTNIRDGCFSIRVQPLSRLFYHPLLRTSVTEPSMDAVICLLYIT